MKVSGRSVLKMFLKHVKTIFIVCVVLLSAKDLYEDYCEKMDRDLDQRRTIDVEVVPSIDGSILSDIVNDHGIVVSYDIYFINNNINTVSISNIDCVIGDSYDPYNSIMETNYDYSRPNNSMTLEAGSNFFQRKSFICYIPYEELEKSIMSSDDKVDYTVVVDDWLKKEFMIRNNSFIPGKDGCNEKTVRVSFITDYDNKEHTEVFDVSYGGMKSDGIRDESSISDSFVVEKVMRE